MKSICIRTEERKTLDATKAIERMQRILCSSPTVTVSMKDNKANGITLKDVSGVEVLEIRIDRYTECFSFTGNEAMTRKMSIVVVDPECAAAKYIRQGNDANLVIPGPSHDAAQKKMDELFKAFGANLKAKVREVEFEMLAGVNPSEAILRLLSEETDEAARRETAKKDNEDMPF